MYRKIAKAMRPAWIMLCILFALSCEHAPSHSRVANAVQPSVERHYGSDLDRILEEKMTSIGAFINERSTVEDVRKANEQRTGITPKEIQAMDQSWMSNTDPNDLVGRLLASPCSQILLAFQEANPAYSEIFITDANGLIVCLTNKTSDFFQADEQWWVTGYNAGKGQAYYGTIEFDESSQTQSIPAVVPIIDPDTKKAIGVCKAVIDITSIKDAL